MAQSASTESRQLPIFITTTIPLTPGAEYHNPIGIEMTRAEIARQAWLDK